MGILTKDMCEMGTVALVRYTFRENHDQRSYKAKSVQYRSQVMSTTSDLGDPVQVGSFPERHHTKMRLELTG